MMHDILDLDRYPLDRPDSDGFKTLVARCRDDLATGGMYDLEGLLRPGVAESIAAAIGGKFAGESFLHAREHNIYFRPSVPGLEPGHPALKLFRTSNNTLCEDQVSGSALAALYRWPPLAAFIAATMGKPDLYPMDDPLAGLNVMSYSEGQALNWHFDRSEFTTTLLLQAPEQGGEFVYRSDLRTEDDPNYDGVARLLAGEDPQVRTMAVRPGTLNVFRGRNTPHRVAPVLGRHPRIIAVLSYYDRPGAAFSDSERLGFFGRVG